MWQPLGCESGDVLPRTISVALSFPPDLYLTTNLKAFILIEQFCSSALISQLL